MEQFQQLTDPTSRISCNIRIRAARLSRSGAVPGLDIEDIEQELRLDLIQRARSYDPAKASFDTFADRIVANCIATLASATKARQAERTMQSLHALVGDKDGDGSLTLSDVLPDRVAHEFSQMHGPGLRSDVGKLLASLCPATRQVAIAVSHFSIAEAARMLGLHRSTIYERLAVIRQIAIRLGLDGYFEAVRRSDNCARSPVNDGEHAIVFMPGLRGLRELPRPQASRRRRARQLSS